MTALRQAALLLAFASCAACAGEEVPVGFRVLTAPDDDPFAVATRVAVAVEQEAAGEQRVLEERFFDVEERAYELPPLPFGTGFRIRVETLAPVGDGEPLVLGRGRSLPFGVLGGAPTRRPDVLVGTLGRFVRTTDAPLDGAPALVAPTDDGARVVTAAGRLYAYVAHAADGQAVLRELARPVRHAEASWSDFGPRRLLAVGGMADEASVYDDDGERLAVLSGPALAPHRRAAAVVELPDSGALALGGVSSDGTESDAVTRLELDETGALVTTSLPPLPFAVRDARAVALRTRGASRELVSRVLLAGGTTAGAPRAEVVLVDPTGASSPIVHDLGRGRSDPAVAVLDVALALVAGGEASDGTVLDDTRLLSVRADRIEPVSPSLPRLSEPRAGAAAVRFGPGLVLLAGGRGSGGRPLSSAELVDTEVVFPGDVVPTGGAGLSTPTAAPRGARLRDDTVLLASPAGVHLYIPPREGGT